MAEQEKWNLSREEINERIEKQNQKHKKKGNFLSFYFFLNVSHPNHPFGGQRTKTADPVDFFVDPKTQKSSKS